MEIKISHPIPINPELDLHRFDSGNSVLDNWLEKKALRNEKNRASRTFVVCQEHMVVGYYSLAVGSVRRDLVISRLRRNMPEPIPVMILARLAVDLGWQGRGLGSDLLRDAILRTIQASELAGIKAILVHAIDQTAAQFYSSQGFHSSPINDLLLLLSLQEVMRSLGSVYSDSLEKIA